MTDKPPSLDSIPYDVFYQIASRLDCYDFMNLSRVNRTTYSLMLTDSLARKTIEVILSSCTVVLCVADTDILLELTVTHQGGSKSKQSQVRLSQRGRPSF